MVPQSDSDSNLISSESDREPDSLKEIHSTRDLSRAKAGRVRILSPDYEVSRDWHASVRSFEITLFPVQNTE
jgi:hypothetical protein